MNRRVTDLPATKRIYQILFKSDINMVLVLGGAGLLLWAAFGVFAAYTDLEAYARMFPLGNATFWASAYGFYGISMWWLVWRDLPPVPSILIGTGIAVLWSWSALARMTHTATLQTGNATSIVYIIIGILIIHRSAKR